MNIWKEAEANEKLLNEALERYFTAKQIRKHLDTLPEEVGKDILRKAIAKRKDDLDNELKITTYPMDNTHAVRATHKKAVDKKKGILDELLKILEGEK